MVNKVSSNDDAGIKEVQPENFINRELSWLRFSERILEEALNDKTPLLEKIRFLSIFSSNNDEFFMVRVAGLKKMLQEGFTQCKSADRMDIKALLSEIREVNVSLIKKQYLCLQKDFLPKLEERKAKILAYNSLDPKLKKKMTKFYKDKIFPVLTPLAVDSSHPFPFLTNLSLYLMIEFGSNDFNSEPIIGFVELSSVLPRLVMIDEVSSKEEFNYVLLDELVKEHLDFLFIGFSVKSVASIRVTRNLDYTLLEDSVVDLLESIQKEVRNREQQEAVRLEVSEGISEFLLKRLLDELQLKADDVYRIDGPLHVPGFNFLYNLPFSELKEVGFNPRIPQRIAENSNIFSIIREKDLLVHHPYDSFYVVSYFLSEASRDKNVLAIKQTLYRSSGDSSIIDHLIKAAENGKHVTAVVELKARFDEKNNIEWARRLERAGVNVVYGFVGLKTHCKASIIVRKEQNKIVRYVHLSTGNYNANTAKSYTDLGLFSVNEELVEDVSSLFNLLTGFNNFGSYKMLRDPAHLPEFKNLIVAPLGLRQGFIENIDWVVNSQKTSKKKGLIVAKLNGLEDRKIIEALYKASAAGVEIRLLVRGICCLRPGIKGLSDNIRVLSIVDRFLEHSRIYYFSTQSEKKVFMGSSDWMSRNMDRRIEIAYLINDLDLQDRIINEILGTYWSDNVKARELQSDGSYVFVKSQGKDIMRAQSRLIDLARIEGFKSIPYDKAIKTGNFKKTDKTLRKKTNFRSS